MGMMMVLKVSVSNLLLFHKKQSKRKKKRNMKTMITVILTLTCPEKSLR